MIMMFHRLFKGKLTLDKQNLPFILGFTKGDGSFDNVSITDYLESLAKENEGKIITLHIFGRIED